MTRDPVIAHCEAMIRRGSRSFSRAAALLPERSRHGAYQLYAWFRYCDDVIDQQVLGQGRAATPATRDTQRAVLAELRRKTAESLHGTPPPEPAFLALERIVRDYGVPPSHPCVMLDGLAMDVEGLEYPTFDDLAVYCYHVAGIVGVMMAYVMDAGDPATLKLAADLGIAFQLTNTARDVIDDAAAGRVYLPLDWLEEAGVPARLVGDPGHRPAVAGVVGRVLERADRYYASADHGLGHLPFRSAWAIGAARGIYSDIGTLVRRRGPGAWTRRAVVPGTRMLYWVGRALVRAARR